MAAPAMSRHTFLSLFTEISRHSELLPAMSGKMDLLPYVCSTISRTAPGFLARSTSSTYLVGFRAPVPLFRLADGGALSTVVPSSRMMGFIAAGAAMAGVGAYVLTEETKGDNSKETAVTGNGKGCHGAGGDGGDPDKYKILLKLLLELCQRDDLDEDNCKFHPIKFDLLKEWYELHQEKLRLKAMIDSAEALKASTLRERAQVDTALKNLKELLSDVLKKEKVLERDLAKLAVDQAEVDEKFVQYGLNQKNLDYRVLSADVDREVVLKMWKEIQEARSAAAGEEAQYAGGQENKGPNGGQENKDANGGKKQSDEESFWTQLINIRSSVYELVRVLDEGSWALYFVAMLVTRTKGLDAEKIQNVKDALSALTRKEHEERKKTADQVLRKIGLPKDA